MSRHPWYSLHLLDYVEGYKQARGELKYLLRHPWSTGSSILRQSRDQDSAQLPRRLHQDEARVGWSNGTAQVDVMARKGEVGSDNT